MISNKKIVFDLKPLKKQFEVCPVCVNCDEPCTYSQNELVLNLYDSEGEHKELRYIFGEENKEDIKACTLEAKMCEDGSAVSRNPDLDCEFDPCPGEINDIEPVQEQTVIKKFFSWVKEIFS